MEATGCFGMTKCLPSKASHLSIRASVVVVTFLEMIVASRGLVMLKDAIIRISPIDEHPDSGYNVTITIGGKGEKSKLCKNAHEIKEFVNKEL